MKTKFVTVVAAAAAASLIGAPIAMADEAAGAASHELGRQARLTTGDAVEGWTITGLKASSDVIPHAVQGTLWEATATDEAIQGSATPLVSNLNARAADGQNYRVLFGVATPQGINPSTLAQGEKSTGKVYFDVTGAAPTTVVYSTGDEDLLVWTPAAPAAPARSGGGQTSAAPARTPSTAPAATPSTAAEGTPAAAGAPLTPGPEGPPASPVPAGSQATPLPAGQQPAPAAGPAANAPAGSQGTPIILPGPPAS